MTKTPEEIIAKRIRDCIEALNLNVEEAVAKGLDVRLDIILRHYQDRSMPLVACKIFKPI